MKILVIFTGGTIGSQSDGRWISPNSKMTYRLLNRYTETHGRDIQFCTEQPYSILSENITAENINALVECVAENKDKGYDGIIVTHGTDTLQYSAAALGFALGTSPVPIVLVSSNYPLDDPRSNGDKNFEAAVAFIKGRILSGVFVSYSNDGHKAEIHSATRLLLHSEMQDAVYSVSGNIIAEYCDGILTNNVSFKCGEYSNNKPEELKLTEKSGILVISSYPGDSFGYDLAGVKAILLRPYHSGTLNTESGELADLCRRAQKANIPMLLTGVYSEENYESTKKFKDLGITPLPLSAFPAMYIKLWIALSSDKNVTDFMLTPLAGEFI